MSKKYELTAIIKKAVAVKKRFETREQANKYMEKLISKGKLQVENVDIRCKKHYQEFVCDTYNRFKIVNLDAIQG